MSYFFEGLPGYSRILKRRSADASLTYLSEFLGNAYSLPLCEAYMQIKSRKVRLAIVELVERLADRQSGE